MRIRFSFVVFGLALFGLLWVACGPAAQPAAEVVIDVAAVPPIDRAKYNVPLEEIYFDTFQPGFSRLLPLPAASDAQIAALRDAIPPIYTPKFEGAAEADGWIAADDLVLGYVNGDEAYAYPMKILNWHEMVSHTVNGVPILATY